MADMSLEPGLITTRAEMKELLGGGPQGGIVPSASTPNVLIYSDHDTGGQSGYRDGWLAEEDGRGRIFEYTGHGENDQTFVGQAGNGNRAILHHVNDGKSLHVFIADGKVSGSRTKRQRYIGEFELDEKQPYIVRQAPNMDGILRRVIVFRLRSVGSVQFDERDAIPLLEKTEAIEVPASTTTSVMIEPETNKKTLSVRSAIPQTEAERREAKLSAEFQAYLESQNHKVKRFQINPKGSTSTLLTDLYDATSHVLYEAKGNSSRNAVRMAIGQLFDYCRHVEPAEPRLAVLLPGKPYEDLQDLLESVGISLVYRDGNSFVECWVR
ncbi:hypothetical protein [Streptosporangium saharense]|uniref:hypothetical protein n=1 Tax=Streptosporangium saharense TaxID=1706840 RepID=UPI0036C23B83